MHTEEDQTHVVQPQLAQAPAQEHRRLERILKQQRTSLTGGIANAVVIKDGELFFLSNPHGDVPLKGEHGYGLYYHDTRYLNGYALRVAGADWEILSASAARCFESVCQLANPPLRTRDGRFVQKEELGLKWERVVDGKCLMLHDVLTLQNFSDDPIELPITATFATAFEPMFEVRGLVAKELGTLRPPVWEDGALSFIYDGADGLFRSLTVRFSRPPDRAHGTTAGFRVRVEPRQAAQLRVTLEVAESPELREVQPRAIRPPEAQEVAAALHRTMEAWLGKETEVASDSLLLDRALARSLRDLRMLRMTLRGWHYYAAGIPWFATLFGRDSIIACLQTLAFEPEIAAQTLRLLASFQGRRVDASKDEQPGKIMHELRVGEMAHLNLIPQTPYYGSVDATPLFLILLGQYVAWTGDLGLFNDLRPNVERALDWIADYGDSNDDGFVDYESTSANGLANQGWKDSGNAIVNDDGSLAVPPIALVEVQGYVYRAKLEIAELFARVGETDRARALRQEASDLRARFNRAFWLDDLGFYALALQAGDRPCAVVSSNPGQALWTGIVALEKAGATCDVLMRDDMFNGWGIRTLAADARAYNPAGYHVGAVWPHDNSLIAAGLRRYGCDDAFRRILLGIVEAALHFPNYRLPEVFSGFARDEYSIPVHYPIACHPQAWAAGAVPYLLTQALGLTPRALDHRLLVRRPLLPDYVQRLDVRRLQVGQATVDLRFTRGSDGKVGVEVVRTDGPLDVAVEDAPPEA